jgi:hypothetical protein
MPLHPETVVAYDATRLNSVKHLARRNGEHVAACGDPLRPFGHIRYIEGYNTDRDSPEATCRPCLFARAAKLVTELEGHVPGPVAEAVNRLPDSSLDEKVEVLLACILRETAWESSVLIREHFPREIVERAEVRAESREV